MGGELAVAQVKFLVKFKEKPIECHGGVRIGKTTIPLHLTEDVNEKDESVSFCAGWKLRQSGEKYIISYQNLYLIIDVNLVEEIVIKSI